MYFRKILLRFCIYPFIISPGSAVEVGLTSRGHGRVCVCVRGGGGGGMCDIAHNLLLGWERTRNAGGATADSMHVKGLGPKGEAVGRRELLPTVLWFLGNLH